MHLKDSVLALPVHQQLGSSDMDCIAASLADCMAESKGTR
jgi:dTDP-4-amino-4,6-dideoxygalactose transaminase